MVYVPLCVCVCVVYSKWQFLQITLINMKNQNLKKITEVS